MKKLLPSLAVFLVLISAIGAVALQFTGIQSWLVQRYIERQVGRAADQLFTDDALRVVSCGTGSLMPSETRAGPCVAVIAGDSFYLVDAGTRSTNQLGLFRLPGERLGGVFVTHFHADHISDLGELNMITWVQGRKAPLSVYGPTGIEQVVAGFNAAFSFDRQHRIAHHGPSLVPVDVSLLQAVPAAADTPTVVLQKAGLTVTMFPVDHSPADPAVGYRFDYRGRSVVVSGDTRKSAKVTAAAKGADVLIHDALASHMVDRMVAALDTAGNQTLATFLADIGEYHSTPVEAAEVANAAGVKQLVLTHLVPDPPTTVAEHLFMRGVSAVRPQDVTVGYDCLTLTLPTNSTAIEQQCLARR